MDETGVVPAIVTSPDGTRLSLERRGDGPNLLMIHSVACCRRTTPQATLPAALAEHFAVTTFDRRGTGESAAVSSYAVEREFEDITAVVNAIGGPVDVYGFSSGATLALLAARAGVPIRRLALLEPPLASPVYAANRDIVAELLVRDRAAAREHYLVHVVGVPPEVLDRLAEPSVADLAYAPTMLHELEFLPRAEVRAFAGVQTPTLLIRSDHTAPEIGQWADELAAVMPNAQVLELPGEWHGVDDATLTAAIRGFLTEEVAA